MRRAVAIAVVLAALFVPAALADGDPASDYLIVRQVFLPFDAKVDKASADELTGLLAAAKEDGFELRVAVISTKTDLGAVPVLYGKPQTYARFLGQELFYWYKHELLVVMPNGYGVYRHGVVPARDRAAIASLPAAGSKNGSKLVAAANLAVRRLAKTHGLALAPAPSPASHSSSTRDRLLIAAAAAAAAALAAVVVSVRRRR